MSWLSFMRKSKYNNLLWTKVLKLSIKPMFVLGQDDDTHSLWRHEIFSQDSGNDIFLGEIQYRQRLEDIRLLKLEIKKLRREKGILTKNVANIEDLRCVRSPMRSPLRIPVMSSVGSSVGTLVMSPVGSPQGSSVRSPFNLKTVVKSGATGFVGTMFKSKERCVIVFETFLTLF